MLRFVYRSLLRLHPRHFRQHFAEEMLCIFDQGEARLAAKLLARRWIDIAAATVDAYAPSSGTNRRRRLRNPRPMEYRFSTPSTISSYAPMHWSMEQCGQLPPSVPCAWPWGIAGTTRYSYHSPGFNLRGVPTSSLREALQPPAPG